MVIQIRGMKKHYEANGTKHLILDIPDWHVLQGERLAIIGPSGSGKSTLFHLLSGLITPDEGELCVSGKPLHQTTEAARDRYRAYTVGYILQDFHLLPSLTALQNVELVMPSKMKERKRKAAEWFERLGLQDRMNHLPSQLSRGQQQRVAIIRALINRPPLVLADEPTGSLDFETARDTMCLLLELCESEGSTLVTVTHDLLLSELYPKVTHIREINRVQQSMAIQARQEASANFMQRETVCS